MTEEEEKITIHCFITKRQDQILTELSKTSLRSKASLVREGIDLLIKWQLLQDHE